jgi:hypothetical protein
MLEFAVVVASANGTYGEKLATNPHEVQVLAADKNHP